MDPAAKGFDCEIRVGYLADWNLIIRKIGALPVRLSGSPSYIASYGAREPPGDVLKHSATTLGKNS